MVKKIAMYGTYEVKEPVKQRYWKLRKDGVRQRYWKKIKQARKVLREERYEFHGTNKDLYKAYEGSENSPKGFVDISAEEFLRYTERYSLEDEWINREVKF